MAGLSNPDIKKTEKIEQLFARLLSLIYKKVYGDFIIRSFPPIIGDGEIVNLWTLFLAVRERGGYEEVSKTELWQLVARDCGYNSGSVPSLKLVYVKYLDLLNRWLKRIEVKNGDVGLMAKFGRVEFELEPEFSGLLSVILAKKGKLELNFEACELNYGTKNVDKKGVVSNVVDDFELKDCGEEVKEKDLVERSKVKENYSGWKRKRGCCLALLKWMRAVAKDPGNEAFGTIPEMSKWKSYGNYHMWKQVLFVREKMFLRIQQSFRENRQMHPAMYEDSAMRCSTRVALVKESRSKCQERIADNNSDSSTDSMDDFWVDGYFQEPAQLGPAFQANVPEWKEATEESDSKWLGSQIFPLTAKQENKYLIERDRIGKGRDVTCGCPSPGSIECVRFHICEKRKKVKYELGPAFYEWEFDAMGEDVTLSWTREDGKKFQEIVKANPFSEGKCFWDGLRKAFPSKKRSALVSYYFNVFLFERRGYQNRETPSLIDSDDDESELCLEAAKQHHPGSILCSPKKVKLKSR